MSQTKRELWLGAGVTYKFFDDYQSVVAEIVEGPVASDEMFAVAHPDGDIGFLDYRVMRSMRRADIGTWWFKGELVGSPPDFGRRAEPRVHDFTRQRWGHQLRFDRGESTRTCFGWGLGLRPGDFILVQRPCTVRYVIERVRYSADPVDQFFATVKEEDRV